MQGPYLWKDVIRALSRVTVGGIPGCPQDRSWDGYARIDRHIEAAIDSLPWYFAGPLKLQASCVALLCLLLTGHRMLTLDTERRNRFLGVARRLPFFGLLEKLVRTLALMVLFDVAPSAGTPARRP